MKCLKCGRNLRKLDSIEKGYGPTCYRKIAATGKTIIGNAGIAGQINLEEFINVNSEKPGSVKYDNR